MTLRTVANSRLVEGEKLDAIDTAGAGTKALFDDGIYRTPVGSGDMLISVYDPTAVNADAFDQDNMVNGTANKNYTATEKTKLAGIETGATANSSDATLLNRANHTGTDPASVIVATQRNIGDSTDLDVALLNLDNSIGSMEDTGFQEWDGVGPYYSIAANQLTLLQSGSGHIRGKHISFADSQVADAFTVNSANYIYIDGAGLIQIATSVNDVFYKDNIALFEVHYDGTDYEVVWENHPISFDTDVSNYLHSTVGTVLAPVAGSDVVGADMVRVATGTGAASGDREVKLVGETLIVDHGLNFTLPDSASAGLTWRTYYTNGSGNWVERGVQTEMFMEYNNAGTMTALPTSGSNVGVFRMYATKEEPNAGVAHYLAIPNTTNFSNVGAAQTAIANGEIAGATGSLFDALEPAQLGYVIVQNNGSGGFINTIEIAKDTVRSGITGSGSSSASLIVTNTTNFDKILSASDSNVQAALETIDEIVKADVGLGNADNTSDATKNAATATLTNKRITARTNTIVSSATPTPAGDTTDAFTITALATAATIAAPTGTPTEVQPLFIRIKDDGTARGLTWNAIYRAGDIALPTTTVLSKTMYLGFLYNSTDSKWDLQLYNDNF